MIEGLPFRWHAAVFAVVFLLFLVVRALRWDRGPRWRADAALVALLVVLIWPVGDLAEHVSLSVAVVQRLVIMLLVVPLVLSAIPTATLGQLTRPFVIDEIVRRLSHPGAAVFVVTVVGGLTVSPVMIDWGARSYWGHGAVMALTLFAGVVLWIPALGVVPGSRRLSPTARAGYLFVSSIVVTILSFVWIFLKRPIYPGLQLQHEILGISPVLDQQLAGFISKLGAYAPMWIIAFYILARADEHGVPVEETPLHWADVERQLLRVDRARARTLRHQHVDRES
jgi:cytochrome c oxidase assembly factor CtaG